MYRLSILARDRREGKKHFFLRKQDDRERRSGNKNERCVSSELSSLNIATSKVRVWWARELTDPLSLSGLLLSIPTWQSKPLLGWEKEKDLVSAPSYGSNSITSAWFFHLSLIHSTNMCSAAIWTQWEKTKVGGFCPLPSQIRDYWLGDCTYDHTSLPNTREGGLDFWLL